MSSTLAPQNALTLTIQDYFGANTTEQSIYSNYSEVVQSIFENAAFRREQSVQLFAPAFEHAKRRAKLRSLAHIDPANTTSETSSYLRNFDQSSESQLEGKVRSFLSLSDDWDGDGAKEIPLDAIYECLNFLNDYLSDQKLPRPSGLSASPDGEIVVYWHGPQAYAELNFAAQGEFSLCTGVGRGSIEVYERPLSETAQCFRASVINTAKDFLQGHFAEST